MAIHHLTPPIRGGERPCLPSSQTGPVTQAIRAMRADEPSAKSDTVSSLLSTKTETVSVSPAAKPFPEEYAMWVDGDCCAPEIPDGCHVLCSTTCAPRIGDYVVIHFTPEAAAHFGYDAWVKRLVMMQRSAKSGRKPRIPSNVAPCLIVEQLNPQRTYVLQWSVVRAVHWCAGRLPAEVQLVPNPAAVARRAARKTVVAA